MQSADNTIIATYYIYAENKDLAFDLADFICHEQTVELPDNLITSQEIKDNIVAKIKSLSLISDNKYAAQISYDFKLIAHELTSFLNVVYGNISMKHNIKLQKIEFDKQFNTDFCPRFGIEGIRKILNVFHRPLLMTALKPVGFSSEQHAEMCYKFAKGGIDIIKDDHNLNNQPFSSFVDRVKLCSKAVSKANRKTGHNCIYVPNITGPYNEIINRAYYAKSVGAGGLLISPGIVGFDVVRSLANDDKVNLPIFCHPTFLGTYVNDTNNGGLSYYFLFGQLMRLAGADGVIFPNVGGRFNINTNEVEEIKRGTLCEMDNIKPIFVVPGGGMSIEKIPQLVSLFGIDSIFLIGGNLLQPNTDIVANSKNFRSKVEAFFPLKQNDPISESKNISSDSKVIEQNISKVASGIRRRVFALTILNSGCYLSQACSSAEIMASLYCTILNLNSVKTLETELKFLGVPSDETPLYTGVEFNGGIAKDKDRFFMTPSQYSVVLYAALIEVGRLNEAALQYFNTDGSSLEMIGAAHSPGLEIMSGSLGQGISQATGIAIARKRKNETGRVVVFMSDGEFQSGQTWECLQVLGHYKLSNVLIFVDVNGYQCDGPVPDVMTIDPLESRIRSFGCCCLEINGNNIQELIRVQGNVSNEKATVILCHTLPWRGLSFLSKRHPKFHYIRPTDQKDKEHMKEIYNELYPSHPLPEKNFVAQPSSNENLSKIEMLSKVHTKNLVKWSANHPEVIVLSADLTSSTEIDLFRAQLPNQFLSMGIAEQNMLSVAGGLAREGFIPFIHTFAVFIYRRAYDQIAMSVAYPNLPVRMFGFLPGLLTPGGATHQAIEDVSVLRSLPNLTILDMGDASDVETVLDAIVGIKGPVYIRMLRGEIPRLFPKEDPLVVNKARKLASGSDILILSSSICTEVVMHTKLLLEKHDIPLSFSHFHVSTLKPFSDPDILSAIKEVKLGIITVENHSIIGGLGTIVSEIIAENGIAKKLLKIGFNDTFLHGASKEYLMNEYGINCKSIIAAIKQLANTNISIDEVNSNCLHSIDKDITVLLDAL